MIGRALIAFFILTIAQVSTTTFSVAPNSLTINAVTNYIWTFTFSPIASRPVFTLTVPSYVTFSNSSKVLYNGEEQSVTSISNNSITFLASNFSNQVNLTLTITLITNPPSAVLSASDFTLTTSQETAFSLPAYNSFSYSNSQLASCDWSFSLCTQQPNSQLSITIRTQNEMLSENNMLIIRYGALWANHNSKSLMFEVTSFSCTVSLNNITSLNTISCINTPSSNLITLTFYTPSPIPPSSTIYINITGVNSPPTHTTPFSSSYSVATADSNGYLIDKLSCNINPVCITNVTNGQFTTPSLTVNQVLQTQQINFISYPIITVLTSDVVQILYNPVSNLVGCSSLKFWRALGDLKILTTSVPLFFIFPSDTQITNSSYPIYLYLTCSAITMPSSQIPTQMIFNFYRSNSQYLQLIATISANAAALNLASASLALSSTQMAHSNTNYVFSFVTGHQLGTTPAIHVGFPLDVNISTATCSLNLNNTPITSLCQISGTTISVNFTNTTSINSNSSFILTISGVTNSLIPQLYNFSLSTFYNSSDSTTMVENSSPAFNATFTTITSLLPTLIPSDFTVYSNTQTNITLITPISIPASSTFFIQFPSAVMQLTCSSQPLFSNNSVSLAANTSLNTSNNSATFNNVQLIPANTTLTFMFILRAPASIGTYNYVNLIISNTIVYIQSENTLALTVSVPSSMPISIIANTPSTDQMSSYTLSLTYTVPHPALFDLVVDIPSDTTYLTTTPGTCTPNCFISSFNSNGSQLTLSITNLFPNSTTIFTASYTIGTLSNRRYISTTGPAFNLTTSVSSSIITKQSTTASITVPSLLTGQLDPNVFYFRNNSASVNILLNLTTTLMSGDYFLLTMDKTTYTGSTVLCSSFYGSCNINPISTTNVIVITIVPNISSYSTNPLQFTIEGLTSGLNTNYFQKDYITVGHYCSQGLIATGKVPYSISCSSAIAFPNQCKTCYSNGSCIDCYSTNGYYLYNSICITSCGSATQFLRYPNSTTSTCEPCSGNCLTCINASACLTCINSSYFLYTDSLTCQLICNIYLGYTTSSVGSQPTCMPCSDSFCLHCNTTDYGTCTLCNNISTINNGVCSSTCLNVSFYISNSQCIACDISCYSCSSGGNQSCIRCASGFVNNSGTCTTTCPTGTAPIPNIGICGCDPACLTCLQDNYISCTACSNGTNFVYLGQCISSCPNGSYQSGNNCHTCPTGCQRCVSGICLSCYSGWYLYKGQCYSDCNQITQQYDISGGACALCPNGCDTCSGSTCSSCLSEYTLQNYECKLTCSLTSSCQTQVVPVPGSIALSVWIGTVLIVVHFAAPLSFMPYSFMLVSAVIQLVLTIVLITISGQTVNARLLYSTNSSNLTTSMGLLGCSLVFNYIFNFIYIFIFMKYIKPLINKPKQSDIIAHGVVLFLATITNYRFGLLAYCKLCPKPRVHIENSSRLTPVHYLCIGTAIIDLLTLIACSLELHTQTLGNILWMLSLDLLIVVIFNIMVTIWFVVSTKPDEYYKDKAKYEVQEENPTNENITNSNEKDISKINIVAIESEHLQDEKKQKQIENINLGMQYRTTRKTKINVRSSKNGNDWSKDLMQKHILTEGQQENQPSYPEKAKVQSLMEQTIEQPSQHEKEVDRFAKQLVDPDFEESVPNKRLVERFGNSKNTSMHATINQSHRYNDLRESRNSNLHRFDKQLEEQEQPRKINNNIFEVALEQQSQIPDLDQVSQIGSFAKKTDNIKLKSVTSHSQSQQISVQNLKKKKMKETKKVNMSAILPKGLQNTYNVQITRQKSDLSQNVDQAEQQDDFEMIVRQKVLESSLLKKQKVKLIQDGQQFEDISPSKYNAANLRFRQNESNKK